MATGGPSGQQLTRFWSLAAAFEHYWTPALRTDLFGSYTAADFNATATTLFCSSPQSPIRSTVAVAGATTTAANGVFVPNGTAALAGCNPDWNVWNAGIRTIWNPAPQFDIGLEVMYTRVETKSDPGQVVYNFAGAGGRAAGVYFPSSENVWGSILRLQRNFWP